VNTLYAGDARGASGSRAVSATGMIATVPAENPRGSLIRTMTGESFGFLLKAPHHK